MERILVLNLGSTSSKIAVYDDEKEIFKDTIRHSNEELKRFNEVLDQFDFRYSKIIESLEKNNIKAESLTAVVSRGGNIQPCPHGAIEIDQTMIDYLTRPEDTYKHASLFGSTIAYELHKKFGIPALIYDAIGTDEKMPLARVSGVPEIPHYTVGHTLNTRAVGIKCAEKIGKSFDECTFIIVHIGGGSSIRLYKDGINIDSVNDDRNHFSPERGGGVSARDLIELCYSGKYTLQEMMNKFTGKGGLKAHLKTADVQEVERMIEAGDEYAKLIFEAMAFNIAKDIGTLSTVVCGKVDRIIITGGVAYSKRLTEYIADHVSFIAPVEVIPGEFEMEALAAGCLRVLRGEEGLNKYSNVVATIEERLRIFPGLKLRTAPDWY